MSSERVRLAVLVGLLAVVAGWGLLRLADGGDDALDLPDEVELTGREVPALELERLTRLEDDPAGSGRNPFTFGAPPTPTPDLTPRPTPTPAPTMPPRPTPTPNWIYDGDRRLPPPPPFDRTFIGHFGPGHTPVAVFRKADQVEVAVPGDVLGDVFVLRSVGLESVTIGYVGYPEEVTARVPIAEN